MSRQAQSNALQGPPCVIFCRVGKTSCGAFLSEDMVGLSRVCLQIFQFLDRSRQAFHCLDYDAICISDAATDYDACCRIHSEHEFRASPNKDSSSALDPSN